LKKVVDYDENWFEKFMEDENSIAEEEINVALRKRLLWTWLSSR
jgi:elongation factor G